MVRALIVLVTFLSLTISAQSETAPNSVSPLFTTRTANARLLQFLGVSAPQLSTPAAQSCCKICTLGKACGNTCISQDKTCHIGAGCACDG